MRRGGLRGPIGMDNGAGFMRRALELAKSGRHRVMPNPMVGCVLVRDGEIVAEGWHDHVGGLHAEQMAIADAEARGVTTRGTTAYVTLEPCNHFGRTPPCTESLLWAGVGRVVIGTMDPNPTVRGGGAEALQQEGVEVEVGLLEAECEAQMGAFMHWCRHRRPQVTLKAATDSRGRIDGDPSEPAERFSTAESLDLAHDLRAGSMAILVGVNTVVRDDPSLTVRGPDIGPRDPPIRVVIDPNDRTPPSCKLLTDGEAPTLLVQSSGFDGSDDPDHVERVVIPEQEIPVARILDMLGDRGVQSLLVEGGADTWGRFLDAGLVDRARLCVSPIELGGTEGALFTGHSLSDSGLSVVSNEAVSEDEVSWWERASPE
ncbi:MAG: bifunctional diaminohydroxyphosphoribosylaminopyrimidine deaminase/5-amino-6-(5-phosphoribosylamino)uracil reductase RibD [Candidatus Thermoplasmatota archaeon]|nr:bifunctional diaminohydroxyphosphoribosylaminopyrimidine deaminase/5-amino-6-(5-phosphoribosylamino)uracil reductase RibD [Candidatus Thermoplasmatota archaeon]MEE2650553.1 bifunctional diaminohydroxyphosphoribosylaminopyrimidine deaminase/5-amino-6-(5-phosphoribosylamino)uracil reductase RibD [Candidatus Thermoplasmatota archaeon]